MKRPPPLMNGTNEEARTIFMAQAIRLVEAELKRVGDAVHVLLRQSPMGRQVDTARRTDGRRAETGRPRWPDRAAERAWIETGRVSMPAFRAGASHCPRSGLPVAEHDRVHPVDMLAQLSDSGRPDLSDSGPAVAS